MVRGIAVLFARIALQTGENRCKAVHNGKKALVVGTATMVRSDTNDG